MLQVRLRLMWSNKLKIGVTACGALTFISISSTSLTGEASAFEKLLQQSTQAIRLIDHKGRVNAALGVLSDGHIRLKSPVPGGSELSVSEAESSVAISEVQFLEAEKGECEWLILEEENGARTALVATARGLFMPHASLLWCEQGGSEARIQDLEIYDKKVSLLYGGPNDLSLVQVQIDSGYAQFQLERLAPTAQAGEILAASCLRRTEPGLRVETVTTDAQDTGHLTWKSRLCGPNSEGWELVKHLPKQPLDIGGEEMKLSPMLHSLSVTEFRGGLVLALGVPYWDGRRGAIAVWQLAGSGELLQAHRLNWDHQLGPSDSTFITGLGAVLSMSLIDDGRLRLYTGAAEAGLDSAALVFDPLSGAIVSKTTPLPDRLMGTSPWYRFSPSSLEASMGDPVFACRQEGSRWTAIMLRDDRRAMTTIF